MTNSVLGNQRFSSPPTATLVEVEETDRKVALRLMMFLFVCWDRNYLDGVNISFALLQMKQDLGLCDATYGGGVSLFFTSYDLLEMPSTLLPKRIARERPSRATCCRGV